MVHEVLPGLPCIHEKMSKVTACTAGANSKWMNCLRVSSCDLAITDAMMAASASASTWSPRISGNGDDVSILIVRCY